MGLLAVEAVDEEEGDELEKFGRQDFGALGGNGDAQALVPHQAHRIHDTPAEAIRVCAGDVAVGLVEHQELAAFRAPDHLVGPELVQQHLENPVGLLRRQERIGEVGHHQHTFLLHERRQVSAADFA